MRYYIDESGNTGDISLTNSTLDFGRQPIFALACIGVKDLSILETHINELKKKYNVLSEELKTEKLYNKKPKFIREVIKVVEAERYPFYIEVVDKKYQLAINIVNCYVMPPYFAPDETYESIFIRNVFSDFLYHNLEDNIFLEFTNTCKEPSESKVLNFFSNLSAYFEKMEGEISQAILISIHESLDDFYQLKVTEGNEAYKRFMPIPDINKKGNLVWILPHYSSFTNIYARINFSRDGDLSNIIITHDEQTHFDEIIKKAKSDCELLRENGGKVITPVANYNFTDSAPLFFADSKKNIGIQVADILAGFVMRYVHDFISNKSICIDKKQSFDILFNNGDPKTGIGMNFVFTTQIVKILFNTVNLENTCYK